MRGTSPIARCVLQIMEGLRASGIDVKRVDAILTRYAQDRKVIAHGLHMVSTARRFEGNWR